MYLVINEHENIDFSPLENIEQIYTDYGNPSNPLEPIDMDFNYIVNPTRPMSSGSGQSHLYVEEREKISVDNYCSLVNSLSKIDFIIDKNITLAYSFSNPFMPIFKYHKEFLEISEPYIDTGISDSFQIGIPNVSNLLTQKFEVIDLENNTYKIIYDFPLPKDEQLIHEFGSEFMYLDSNPPIQQFIIDGMDITNHPD